jgi:sporulation protein YlmC with PRC-barrel domain
MRTQLLAMTATVALFATPVLAQQGGSSTGGSSMQGTTTQTTPQQGPLSSTTGAQSGATPGGTGPSTSAQGTQPRDASGGVMAQQTAPGSSTSAPRDGTPGNPPSTATQRAVDAVTGDRTPPDGTPGNPPGTAVGRAIDRATGTPATTGATTDRSSMATGAGTAAMAVDSAALRNVRRASRIIGSTVYNENNDSIGEVEDILVPAAGGPSMGNSVAVISVGGFLGIGAKLVAVPYERLTFNAERNRWTLPGATKDSLTQLPTYSHDAVAGERRG